MVNVEKAVSRESRGAQQEPVVSVVITCYNQARFLSETIESVLTQTYPNFEIVIVDDGSTDNTEEVVARYPWLKYIRQQNRGVVAARTTGYRACEGDYLLFLDGDDRLLPHALEIGAGYLQAKPELGFVYGRLQLIDGQGNPTPNTYVPPTEDDHYSALLQDNHIWMPAMVIYRRRVFEAVNGFSAAADHSSDYDLYLRISRNYPVYRHNEVVAEYRMHGANTHGNTGLMLEKTMRVFRAQWNYVKGDPRLRQSYEKGLQHWTEFYGEKLYVQTREHLFGPKHDPLQAIKGAFTLLHYSPCILRKHLKHIIRRRLSKSGK